MERQCTGLSTLSSEDAAGGVAWAGRMAAGTARMSWRRSALVMDWLLR
jgi:hypothetical protein